MAEERAMAPPTLSKEAIVSLVEGEDVIHDSFFYLCGRLLSKKVVVIPSFSAGISNVWRLKERVLIRQEADDIFVFQFKESEVKNQVLAGAPWFYNNSMLLLADYDGISALEAAPLHHLEVWVVVKGLCITMRNEKALTLIGQALRDVVRVDQGVMQRKDPVQRIRVIQDVCRRIWARRLFDFSSSVSVMMELNYEKCHRHCATCGFFNHGGGFYDKRLAVEASLDVPSREVVEYTCGGLGLESVSGLRAAVEAVAGTKTVLAGSELPSSAADMALMVVDWSASAAVRVAALASPEKAGNPNFELGLIGLQYAGLGRMADKEVRLSAGPGAVGKWPKLDLGSENGPKLALGVKKKSFKPSLAIIPREFQLGELVEIPISIAPPPK